MSDIGYPTRTCAHCGGVGLDIPAARDGERFTAWLTVRARRLSMVAVERTDAAAPSVCPMCPPGRFCTVRDVSELPRRGRVG